MPGQHDPVLKRNKVFKKKMHAQFTSALTSIARLGSGPLLKIVLAVSLQGAESAHLPEPLQEALFLSLGMCSQNFLGQAQLLKRPLFLAEATGCTIQGLGPTGHIFYCLCNKKQAINFSPASTCQCNLLPRQLLTHAAHNWGRHSLCLPQLSKGVPGSKQQAET